MELIDTGHRRISRYLDLTRIRVLGMVVKQGPVRPSAIVAELGMTASAVSRHLTALERAGQVAMEVDPMDARTFLVRHTALGHDEIDTTVQAGGHVFADVIADWSDDDVATARVLIDRLNLAWARQRETGRSVAGSSPGPRWKRSRTATSASDRKN